MVMMKNLTHYFKSPKEDETSGSKDVESEQVVEIVQEKKSKKRKISLSKSKKKDAVTQDSENLSSNQNVQRKIDGNLVEKSDGKQSKKRKLDGESCSSLKKLKTTNKSEKIEKKTDSENKFVPEVNQQIQSKKSVNSENVLSNSKDDAELILENSVSSDETLFKAVRKPKKNFFIDSDEETEISNPETHPKPLCVDVESHQSSSSSTSRNSLFSYFNKVDKETALKQRKPEKIEVKAIVHSYPNGLKIKKRNLDKEGVLRKKKLNKNKSHLDDSDSIEVISSEEIVDENSFNHVNVPLEIEQEKISSSPDLKSESIKSQPLTLASIFIPKKISSLQTKSLENISSEISEKDNKTQIDQSEKESKKQSNRKKNVKRIKSLRTKNKLQNETEDQPTEKNCIKKDDESMSKINGVENFLLLSTKDLDGNLNSSKKSESAEKLLTTKNLEVISSKKIKDCECNMTEKPNLVKPEVKSDEVTPRKKGSTLNGYFTPKNVKLNVRSNGDESSDRPKSATRTKAPWVMKVCLSSASKKSIDSDEDDYKSSQDSGKGDSESIIITPEESCRQENSEVQEEYATPLVVVIDDDDDNSAVEACSNDSERKPLSGSAKKVKSYNNEKEEERKENKPGTPKSGVKVWPFFLKGGARQPKEAPVDEAKLKAKMLFLESGVPESIKRKVESVKSDTVAGLPAPFPTVSHVRQAAVDDDSCDPPLPLPLPRSISPPPDVPVWTPLLPVGSPEEGEIPVFERPKNVKAFLEKLKEEEPKTEVKVLYKKLKEYKSKAESDIWTEVYKPTNSADMVGNSEGIKKLKTWLETLKNCRKREGSVSSGDEFVSDDSDGDDSSFNNMAVISGPCGCGKTSAVYAIARELDIKVLEINASCNRSGKRILAEFSESTQSHHVERSQPSNGFFNNQSSAKKKRKKLKTSDKLKSEKTSLILVEDADLLFSDCDEGFVPALASLAASSKRPIVLVTNQESSPHLERFNNAKLLRVSFSRPKPNKLGLWLRLVGLVEGVVMSADLASRFVTTRNCDVRRCLLELQLMVHSNNSEVRDKVNVSRLWWGWPSRHGLSYELPTLLEPEEGEGRGAEVDKAEVVRRLAAAADVSRRLAGLDLLRVSDREECQDEQEDPCPVAWAARWRDSTALTAASASHSPAQGHAAAWLTQTLARTDGHGHDLLSCRTGQSPQEARWLSILRQGEQMYMSGVAMTVYTNHQSVACDYLPTLRELGRSEQVRLTNYTRRANRFFNYLQGLGIHASKSYRDFMCDAFS